MISLLKDISEIITGPFGSQLHAEDYVQGGIPSIMPANLKNGLRIDTTEIARISLEDTQRLSRFLVKQGDIVFSRRGDVRRCAFISEREEGWLCGTGCLRVRPNMEHVYPLFLAYFLSQPAVGDWLEQRAVGATLPNLNTSILGGIEVMLPPLDEQRRIAGILGAFDDQIEVLRQQNRTLEAMARALFRHWFVDFEFPSDGSGGVPEGQPYRSSGGRMKDSALGEIPEGWEVGTPSSLIADSFGGDWGEESLSEEYNSHSAVIRGTDFDQIKGGKIDKVPLRYLKEKSFKMKSLSPNDVIIEISGGSKDQPTGRTLRITEEILRILGGSVVAASFCRTIRFKSVEASTFFSVMMAILYYEGGTWEYQNQSTGISNFKFPHFISNHEITLPSTDLLQHYYHIVTNSLARVDLNVLRLNRLSKTRDTLLPRLMSGELSTSPMSPAAALL